MDQREGLQVFLGKGAFGAGSMCQSKEAIIPGPSQPVGTKTSDEYRIDVGQIRSHGAVIPLVLRERGLA